MMMICSLATYKEGQTTVDSKDKV